MPTIAQIGGNCIGGGCALAVACDLRFAAEDARLGITPARLGLAYSLGDVRRLPASSERPAPRISCSRPVW